MAKKYWKECSECGGEGRIMEYHGGEPQGSYTCPECDGKGGKLVADCPNCGGSGMVMDYHGAEPQGWYPCPECS